MGVNWNLRYNWFPLSQRRDDCKCSQNMHISKAAGMIVQYICLKNSFRNIYVFHENGKISCSIDSLVYTLLRKMYKYVYNSLVVMMICKSPFF